MTVLTLTTGTTFIMWLGEQITDRGVGNGMSLLIFAGIVDGLPRGIADLIEKAQDPGLWSLHGSCAGDTGRRHGRGGCVHRLCRALGAPHPGAVCKRIVGRRLMGGQSTHLPLKVNSGGVMPVIFASSILSAPLLFASSNFMRSHPALNRIFDALRAGEPWYELLSMVAIVFFAYFYISIVFRPDDIADNMRKYGGFIPGIRPGRRTSDYINDILTRITLVGAIYLIVVCADSADHDQRHPPREPVAGGLVLREDADLGDAWPGAELLLRRHLASDRGRRGHGHGEPGRIAADHAAL